MRAESQKWKKERIYIIKFYITIPFKIQYAIFLLYVRVIILDEKHLVGE